MVFQMEKKVVVLDLGHALYLCLHVAVCSAWKCHWLHHWLCLPCIMEEKNILIPSVGSKENEVRNVKNDGSASYIMKEVSIWARPSPGKSMMQTRSLPWFKRS